jgi:hypothetical protein
MDYTTFKNKAIDSQPILYKTRLKNVAVNDLDNVSVDGKTLPIDEGGLNSLQKIVRLPQAFSRRMDSYLGEVARVKLLDALRDGVAERKDEDVNVAISRNTGEVLGFSKGGSVVSAEGFFDLVERVVDRYNLDLQGQTIGTDGSITLKSQIPNRRIQVANLDDEVFKSGLTLNLDMGQVNFKSYLKRLICTNGMIGGLAEDNVRLNALNADMMVEFFQQMDELSEDQFLPIGFRDNVRRAMNTPASLYEMEAVRSQINRHSVEPNNRYNEWFLPLEEVNQTYREMGYDPSEMSAKQKHNTFTNQSVWDVINVLTDFASHDQTDKGYNFTDAQATAMQVSAGRMFGRKNHDLENLVPIPRGFNLN